MPQISSQMSPREQLQILSDLSDCLQQHLDLGSIAEAAVKLIAGTRGKPAVMLAGIEADELVMTAAAGFSDEFLNSRRRIPITTEVWPCRVARQQVVKVSAAIASDTEVSSAEKKVYAAQGISSGMVLPLQRRGIAIGILSIAYDQENCVGEDMQLLFSTFANMLSVSISGADQLTRYEYQSRHDSLTGLPNRNYLFEVGHQVLSDLLLLIDINRFKEINNNLGHDIGDQLLQRIGPRVNEALKGNGSIVYSFGGDSFAVLVPHLNGSFAADVCAGVELALRKPFVMAGFNLELNLSLGYACAEESQADTNKEEDSAEASAEDTIELYRRADIALAAAKSLGGGTVAYSSTMEFDRTERLAIMSDLGEAIREDQLQLYYQPKIDLQTGRLLGCEALLRWHHPQHGMMPPGKFIPIVESSHWIIPLTEWVIKTSLQQLQQWQSQGINISVAVNLSPRNLEDSGCFSMVARLLQDAGVASSYLELEVTETALMHNPEASLAQVQKLEALGIKFSLDDYGTGYSSLAYIRDLTLSSLKIDRSFIAQMLRSAADRVIVESTINMAHSLGLQVVAEGIEDADTATVLKQLGCDVAQGYYFARPMPSDEFLRWFESR